VLRVMFLNGPLYIRILVALVLGVIAGIALGARAVHIALPAQIVIQFLNAIAAPLIMVAVIRALVTADVSGKDAVRMGVQFTFNTLVAITIGLLIANTLKPGLHAQFDHPAGAPDAARKDPWAQLLSNLPSNLLRPIVEGNTVGAIIVALAVALALRKLPADSRASAAKAAQIAFDCLVIMLHWVIAVVPLAIFCKVASIVGEKGFAPFKALGAFIIAVLLGLSIQFCFYMVRLRLGSWVRPHRMLRGGRDAFVMAFSTASSTATLPVTYDCLRNKIGVSEKSATLGALVGSNFNHDGTALYEATSALFISQLIGMHLSLAQQIMVVLTSVVASVGAAGIPEAGLITMTLVFNAVGLPTEFIVILVTVDWLLDRCRTMINCVGDVTVCCILDGRKPPQNSEVERIVAQIEAQPALCEAAD
jgi:Na+/H+-dicarboxylate symporter